THRDSSWLLSVAKSTKSRKRARNAQQAPQRTSHVAVASASSTTNGSVTLARKTAHTPRALMATTALCLLFALAALGWDLTDRWRTASPVASGQIARPLGGGIALIDPATGKVTELVRGESSAIATAVAWSPDRTRLAFSVFHKRPE